MRTKLLICVLCVIIETASYVVLAEVSATTSNRVALYKADKRINFENWPRDERMHFHPTDMSNTIARVSVNAKFLHGREVSQFEGIKYERDTYRVWQSAKDSREELTVRVTSVDSVTNAHNYLLLRWANVSAPYLEPVKGSEVELDVGDICFVTPHSSGGIQVLWFVEGNVVVEIRGSGAFTKKVRGLAESIERELAEHQ